jgi:hypothetical protein
MFPTLAGLVGLGNKLDTKTLDGKNLSKALIANNPKLGPERTFTVKTVDKDYYPGEIYVRSQKYKFIRWNEQTTRPNDKLPVMMLFDMDKDPYETNNLAYEPEYENITVAESKACDDFMAQFYKLKPVALTHEMLNGKKKESIGKQTKGKNKANKNDNE